MFYVGNYHFVNAWYSNFHIQWMTLQAKCAFIYLSSLYLDLESHARRVNVNYTMRMSTRHGSTWCREQKGKRPTRILSCMCFRQKKVSFYRQPAHPRTSKYLFAFIIHERKSEVEREWMVSSSSASSHYPRLIFIFTSLKYENISHCTSEFLFSQRFIMY